MVSDIQNSCSEICPQLIDRSHVNTAIWWPLGVPVVSVTCVRVRWVSLTWKYTQWNIFLAATKQLYKWYFPSVCLSVRLSVRLSVTPFWLCSHHWIIMKFSEVITNDQRKVHAKGQGQRSKVKVTEVTTQLNRFRTVTPVWIHIWWWNDAYSLMLLWRGALLFLAATKQLYKWYFRPSVRLSVCPSVCPSHLFDYVPIIGSSWNFLELLPMTNVRSVQKVKVRGQRSRSQRSQPNLTVSGL